MKFSQKLDNKENYNIDVWGIGTALKDFPKQCSDALSFGQNLPKSQEKPEKIFLCGVGGSGLAGKFIYNIGLHHGETPIFLIQDYILPPFAKKDDLVVALSYSGSTEEVLSVFEDAKAKGCSLLAITSGGALKAQCEKYGCPFVLLPQGFQPRMATFFLALPVIEYFNTIGIFHLDYEDFGELYFHLEKLSRQWNPEIPAVENRSKVAALRLFQKKSLIWGSIGNTDMAAVNFKNQINENAKCPAYANFLPEVNHNEIMAFESVQKETGIILLRSHFDSPRIQKRFEITKMVLENQVGVLIEFAPQKKSFLTSLSETIYFGNWVSYYLSILGEVNPKEIKGIQEFKARMAR